MSRASHLHDAPEGEGSKGRAGPYGKVPRSRGKNRTLIASITLDGAMGAAISIEGATDAEVFEAYAEGFLAPTLEAGQVVVSDGLGRTRRARSRRSSRGGARITCSCRRTRRTPTR